MLMRLLGEFAAACLAMAGTAQAQGKIELLWYSQAATRIAARASSRRKPKGSKPNSLQRVGTRASRSSRSGPRMAGGSIQSTRAVRPGLKSPMAAP